MSTSPPAAKRQRTAPSPPYELIYWPSIPGRGEFIRLAFEATSTPYTDTSNLPSGPGAHAVLSLISPSSSSNNNNNNPPGEPEGANPPPLAPPLLRHGDLLIAQTSNILLYLGPRLGLAGRHDDDDGDDDDEGVSRGYHINQLALTALDGFSDEAHETHHPVSSGAYYEDQRAEAGRRARDYREVRLPKFLGYFERVMEAQEGRGYARAGEGWLYGRGMTWADLVLWQGLDGVGFAFPRRMGRLREEGGYARVFGLYDRVKGVEGVREYLGSERRMKYGNGIWRHYPELDGE